MNIRIIFNFLLLTFGISAFAGSSKADFDREAFYNAMAASDLNTVNTQLSIVKSSTISEKQAYEGALLMKKAGLVSKAQEKLSLFKQGRAKLEAAIKKDKGNAEFSFLRLIIQEHAPKVVEYRSNINDDISSIRSNFKILHPVVQQAINDYTKKSKFLKAL